ncbi:MAG: DUF58 domain-containing protein [Anaerolineae bacterium]
MPNLLPFLIALFLIAAWFRIDFFFNILYLLFTVYLLSRLWVQRVTANVQVERRFVERAFPGDEVHVELRVSNTGWLPAPWLEVRESLPVQLASPPFHHVVLSLGPHETRRLRYRLRCRRRGYYTLGPLTVRIGDVFGVHESSRRPLEDAHLIVYPEVVPLMELGLPTHAPLPAIRAPSPLFEDPARIMGVRHYRVGDSPRRIHWSATAAVGELLVKQYEPAIARDTLICLDLDRDSYEMRYRYTAPELAIKTAASLANHIVVQEGLPAGLVTAAWDPLTEQQVRFALPPRSERSHLMNILEILARVQLTQEPLDFSALLRQASADLAWGTTVVAVTGRESAALFDVLAYLRQAGFVVALALITPAAASPEIEGHARVLKIPLYRVWSEEDLEMLA